MKYYKTLGDALNNKVMDRDVDDVTAVAQTRRRGPHQASYQAAINTPQGAISMDAEATFYPDETDFDVASISEQDVAAYCAQNQAVQDANAGQQVSQNFVRPMSTYADGTMQPASQAISVANATLLAPVADQANMSMSSLVPVTSNPIYATNVSNGGSPITNAPTSAMSVSNISASNSFYNGEDYSDCPIPMDDPSHGLDPSIFNSMPQFGDSSAAATQLTNAATAASGFVTNAQTTLAPVVTAAQAAAPNLLSQFQALPAIAQAGLLVGGYMMAKKVPLYYLLAAGGLFAATQLKGSSVASMMAPAAGSK